MIFTISELLQGGAALALVFAAAEAGFRLGIRRQPHVVESTRVHFAALQAALFALLALVLAFTFSIAVERFDARQELVIEEANAIAAAYQRSRLLAEPQRKEAVGLLHLYVDQQLVFYDAGVDSARLDTVNATIAALQERLWLIAIAVSEQDPHSVPTGLFVQSLNGMIGLHTKRMEALENRLPDAVIYLVFLVTVVAMGFVGYGRGLVGRRYFLATAIMGALIVLILATILDLDRPRQGLITVSQSSLERLQEVLREAQH